MNSHVAIIIPVFGASVTVLPQCLASIARQTERSLSMTVVDDGNAHPISTTIVPWGFPFSHSVIRQAHAGAPVARNAGARATRSQWLLFCDADVLLAPHAITTLLHALKDHPEASYAYSAFRFGWKRFRSFPFDADRLRTMPYIHTTALIRRSHFPGFDETLPRFQDWDLWWTMLDQGHRGIYVPEELFRIAHTRGTMSRWMPSIAYRSPWRTKRMRAYEEAKLRILKKHRLWTSPSI